MTNDNVKKIVNGVPEFLKPVLSQFDEYSQQIPLPQAEEAVNFTEEENELWSLYGDHVKVEKGNVTPNIDNVPPIMRRALSAMNMTDTFLSAWAKNNKLAEIGNLAERERNIHNLTIKAVKILRELKFAIDHNGRVMNDTEIVALQAPIKAQRGRLASDDNGK